VDKGVPTDYHSMIGLVMRLREVNNQNHRVLVHCRLNIFDKIVFFSIINILRIFLVQESVDQVYLSLCIIYSKLLNFVRCSMLNKSWIQCVFIVHILFKQLYIRVIRDVYKFRFCICRNSMNIFIVV